MKVRFTDFSTVYELENSDVEREARKGGWNVAPIDDELWCGANRKFRDQIVSNYYQQGGVLAAIVLLAIATHYKKLV